MSEASWCDGVLFQVNQKGSEKPLEQAFAKMVSDMDHAMLK